MGLSSERRRRLLARVVLEQSRLCAIAGVDYTGMECVASMARRGVIDERYREYLGERWDSFVKMDCVGQLILEHVEKGKDIYGCCCRGHNAKKDLWKSRRKAKDLMKVRIGKLSKFNESAHREPLKTKDLEHSMREREREREKESVRERDREIEKIREKDKERVIKNIEELEFEDDKLIIKSMSGELRKNIAVEKKFREWVERVVEKFGRIEVNQVVNAGAEYCGGSQQAVRRYLDKMCSFVGKLDYLEDGGKRYVVLRIQVDGKE